MEKKKAGRKSVPDAEKAVKVTITLPPTIAQILDTKTNKSAYIAALIQKDNKI